LSVLMFTISAKKASMALRPEGIIRVTATIVVHIDVWDFEEPWKGRGVPETRPRGPLPESVLEITRFESAGDFIHCFLPHR
jgi:hypothetical protein